MSAHSVQPSATEQPRRLLGVPVRRTREGLIIGLPGSALRLSDTAEFIYRHLDGHSTVLQVAEQLSQEYDVSASEVLGDVIEMVAYLAREHVVEW